MTRTAFSYLCLCLALAGCAGHDLHPAAGPESSEHRFIHGDVRRVVREAGIYPGLLKCNSHVFWRSELNHYAEEAMDRVATLWGVAPDPGMRERASHTILGYLVRSMFEQLKPNNLGGMRLRGRFYEVDGERKPLLIFRTGVHTDGDKKNACLDSLIEHGRVRHIINLYCSSFPLHDLIEKEMEYAGGFGATCHNEVKMKRPWRRLVEKSADYEKNFTLAQARVAALINTEILRPRGQDPRGNILVHCGGGMHRTGMVYGILQKCVNGDPPAWIEAVYKRHVAYQSEKHPGGYEPLNLRFIRDFDCKLLKP